MLTKSAKPNYVRLAIQATLITLLPVLLALGSARLVMIPVFLEIQYRVPGFPEDRYGFTLQDRLYYAPYALNYLHNDAGIDYLGDLQFPDGTPLFNERELEHMEDVKVVTRAAFSLLTAGAIIFLAISIGLARTGRALWLRQALLTGSVVTLALILTVVIVAAFAWEFFFDTFHRLLFADGTWRFPYSDTLIRLYPEPFWFAAALTIGFLTISGALLIFGLSWWWGRRSPTSLPHS